MSSKHSVIEEANIRTSIIHSKAGVSTTESTEVRTLIHFWPRSVSRHLFMHGHLEIKGKKKRIIFKLCALPKKYRSKMYLLLVAMLGKTVLRYFRSLVTSEAWEGLECVHVLTLAVFSTTHGQVIDVANECVPRPLLDDRLLLDFGIPHRRRSLLGLARRVLENLHLYRLLLRHLLLLLLVLLVQLDRLLGRLLVLAGVRWRVLPVYRIVSEHRLIRFLLVGARQAQYRLLDRVLVLLGFVNDLPHYLLELDILLVLRVFLLELLLSHDRSYPVEGLGQFGLLADLFLLLFQLLRVEAVEQQGQEEVEHHEVSHNQGWQKNGETSLGSQILLGSHAVPEWFDPLAAEYTKNHHERVKEVVEVPSGHGIWLELVRCVILAEQLHPDDGEYVNHDYEHEGQVTQRADGRDYDAQEYLHGGPGLG